MAKITVEQLRKINSKCGNGFELDVMYYINWGEKRFDSRFELEVDNVLCITVSYRKVQDGFIPEIKAQYEKKKSDDGKIAMYRHDGSDWCKKICLIDQIRQRRDVDVLQKITREMSEAFIDKLKEMYVSGDRIELFINAKDVI